MTTKNDRITPLLAGMDTVYFSCDLPLSDAMRERLAQEKVATQTRAAQRQVYCPEWLEACIAPQGAKGGYAFLIETEDFSLKLLGEHIQNRPSVFIEMRSHALHTHPEGAAGACEAALGWYDHISVPTSSPLRRTQSPSMPPRSRAPTSTSTGKAAMRPVFLISRRSCAASSVQVV
jgi:hypothetical protein